jgi:hypothetical protein
MRAHQRLSCFNSFLFFAIEAVENGWLGSVG